MHVIAKAALVAFWKTHPDAEPPLQAWYRLMEKGVFKDFKELRAIFASADYVEGLTVFDIGGNKYRLIAYIRFEKQIVYIKAVLTHRDYDKGAWKS